MAPAPGTFSSPVASIVTSIAPTSHPLGAQYSIRYFRPALTAWVEFGTDTSYGRQTSVMTNSVTAPVGQALNILVAGMKPQTTYHMRVLGRASRSLPKFRGRLRMRANSHLYA